MILVAKQSLVSIYMHHGNNHDHRPVSKYPGALRYIIMTRLIDDTVVQNGQKWPLYLKASGNFASRGKIALCYFAICRQNSPNGYFAANAKLAVSLMLTQKLTQTLTLILTLIPSLAH